MKSGPFAEHSNILWGISSVAAWEKVNSGLIKMYKVEVTGQNDCFSFYTSLKGDFLTVQGLLLPPLLLQPLASAGETLFLPVYFWQCHETC